MGEKEEQRKNMKAAMGAVADAAKINNEAVSEDIKKVREEMGENYTRD